MTFDPSRDARQAQRAADASAGVLIDSRYAHETSGLGLTPTGSGWLLSDYRGVDVPGAGPFRTEDEALTWRDQHPDPSAMRPVDAQDVNSLRHMLDTLDDIETSLPRYRAWLTSQYLTARSQTRDGQQRMIEYTDAMMRMVLDPATTDAMEAPQ